MTSWKSLQIIGLTMTLMQLCTVTVARGIFGLKSRNSNRASIKPFEIRNDAHESHQHDEILSSYASNSQLRQAVDSFASIEHEKDIPMDQLLTALHKFHSVLKEAAPAAVSNNFLSNLRKAESSYEECKRKQNEVTLSTLLRHEQQTGQRDTSHDEVRLNSNCGAMGLLWMRRSLAFQADMYDKIAHGVDTKQAAMMAYERQLQSYHSWGLRKIFQAAGVRQMPDRNVLLAKIGGYDNLSNAEERETIKDLNNIVSLWKPLLQSWTEKFETLGMEDVRRI